MRALAKTVLRRVPWLRRQLFASVDYRVLSRDEAQRRQAQGWSSPRTTARQDKAYQTLLRAMHEGRPRVDLQVAVESVAACDLATPSILEVGCGSGYYREVFDCMLRTQFDYVGVDYSAAMIELARQRYPHARFEVADACQLPFADAEFDIVFNGVCLMHVLDFRRAIAEGRRVSRRFCVYHSVPTFAQRPTTYLSKYAYGGEVVEIVFNRRELIDIFRSEKMEVAATWPSIDYDVSRVTGERSTCETFLLRRS